MNSFVQKHQAEIIGVLSGFDRLVVRGTVRPVAYAGGMTRFLSAQGILLKDFGAYAEATSNRVQQASLAVAERVGRPVQYLASPKVRKDELTRDRDAGRDRRGADLRVQDRRADARLLAPPRRFSRFSARRRAGRGDQSAKAWTRSRAPLNLF